MGVDSPALEGALLEALRPRGWERLSQRLAGGYAAAQLLERLPPELRGALSEGEANPVLARRAAVQRVTRALQDLQDAGRVERRQARLKSALVDVYRLRR